MSYCVNCGVELDSSATKCVLCSTPVINPNEQPDEEKTKPYSDIVVIPAGVRRRYVAFLLSMIVIIPNIVCVLLDIFFSKDSTWSAYVAASGLLVWMVFIQPFFWKKPNPYLLLLLDSVAVTAFIYVFYYFRHYGTWFWELALPLVIFISAIICVFISWFKRAKRRDWPQIATGIAFSIAVISVAAELAVVRYCSLPKLGVSIIVCACCAALVGFFAAVSKSRRFRAWLSRKFFV